MSMPLPAWVLSAVAARCVIRSPAAAMTCGSGRCPAWRRRTSPVPGPGAGPRGRSLEVPPRRRPHDGSLERGGVENQPGIYEIRRPVNFHRRLMLSFLVARVILPGPNATKSTLTLVRGSVGVATSPGVLREFASLSSYICRQAT